MRRIAFALVSAFLVGGCSGAAGGADASVDASPCKEGEFHYVDEECHQYAPPLGRTCTGRGDGLCYERCTDPGAPCHDGLACRAVRLYAGASSCPSSGGNVNVCVPDGWKDGCQRPGPDAGTTGFDAALEADGSSG